MILGTAGHVDHGKSALVKALTGVDPDRWAEEKRRGITIDLGFAPLDLGPDGVLGIVDVPGHEAFVRNMLAGATGVDLVLLVVAADEGVMPQTREHLAILDLLGVRGGVIALTKCDLVEPDWLALVREDVRALVAGSALGDAPIVPTSVQTNEGLDALRAALAQAARAIPARDAGDLFRLPIDRAFSVRGTGTVVTGTVWSGRLERDATVRVLPGRAGARVRGLQSHGAAIDVAQPGSRTAVALAGVEVHDVGRGQVLVTDDGWTASTALIAEVALLSGAVHGLGPRTAVRFHLGTAEVGARVVTAHALVPGARAAARVVLDAPIVARGGDRFVLRSASPLTTIGGGIVIDPAPPQRRARPVAVSAHTPAERLTRVLESAGQQGVALVSLPVRIGAPPDAIDAIVRAAPAAELVGDRLYAAPVLAALAARVVALIEEHHAQAPLDAGAPLQAIRARTTTNVALAEHVVASLARAGRIELHGSLVRRPGWAPRLTDETRTARDAIREAIESAGREPPSVDELERRFGPGTLALLKLLEQAGHLVPVAPDRFYARSAVERLEEDLRTGMEDGRERTPSELRELLGVSRKFLIPLLEYCDRTGLTERRASGRTLGARARGRVAARRPEDSNFS